MVCGAYRRGGALVGRGRRVGWVASCGGRGVKAGNATLWAGQDQRQLMDSQL